MSALATLGRSLPRVLSPAPIIDLPSAEDSAAQAFALLDDLLEAKRIMPTEHRTIQQTLKRLLATIACNSSRDDP